jgi:hypothetical protein
MESGEAHAGARRCALCEHRQEGGGLEWATF